MSWFFKRTQKKKFSNPTKWATPIPRKSKPNPLLIIEVLPTCCPPPPPQIWQLTATKTPSKPSVHHPAATSHPNGGASRHTKQIDVRCRGCSPYPLAKTQQSPRWEPGRPCHPNHLAVKQKIRTPRGKPTGVRVRKTQRVEKRGRWGERHGEKKIKGKRIWGRK